MFGLLPDPEADRVGPRDLGVELQKRLWEWCEDQVRDL